MVQFKSAPGSRQAMFNRNPSIAFQKKKKSHGPAKASMARARNAKRTLKHAELGESRLTTTELSRNEQQIVQLPTIRLAASSSDTTGSQIVVSDAASGVVAAVGVGAAVVWILGIVVLIFVVWGIVRSGQEMAAKNAAELTASPWYFGIMIAVTAMYVILNIVGSSLADDMGSAITGISGSSAQDDQEAAVKAAQASAGSNAAYGVASVFGLGAFCMSIAALAKLKLTKGKYARSRGQ